MRNVEILWRDTIPRSLLATYWKFWPLLLNGRGSVIFLLEYMLTVDMHLTSLPTMLLLKPLPKPCTQWLTDYHGISHNITSEQRIYFTVDEVQKWIYSVYWFYCVLHHLKMAKHFFLDAKCALNRYPIYVSFAPLARMHRSPSLGCILLTLLHLLGQVYVLSSIEGPWSCRISYSQGQSH
jgi:hypothetical protein